MSKTVTYTCNLCGRSESSKDAKDVFRSFYWKSSKMPQGYVLSVNLDCCDRHICNDCIDVIRKEKLS